jgi:hypothetical protein
MFVSSAVVVSEAASVEPIRVMIPGGPAGRLVGGLLVSTGRLAPTIHLPRAMPRLRWTVGGRHR